MSNHLFQDNPRKPVRVIFIAGSVHSGSTILDIVLGNHPELQGTGELSNLHKVWQKNHYCSCGVKVQACPFWSDVVQMWREELNGDALTDYGQLQVRYEKSRSIAFIAVAALFGSHSFERYRRYNFGLFSAIKNVSGKSILVDSSKRPIRALALSLVSGIDLRVIHLVRDGRGVAWSFSQSRAKNAQAGVQRDTRPRNVIRVAVTWAITNLITEYVCKWIGTDRCVRIRHEDLVAQPQQFLELIGETFSIDLSSLGKLLDSRKPLDPGHIVAGNRLRMKEEIILKNESDSWRFKLPPLKRRTFGLVCARVLRRYGYF